MKLIQFDGKLEREKGRFWQMGAYHKSVETHGIFGTLLGNKRLWVVGVMPHMSTLVKQLVSTFFRPNVK